MPPSLAAGLAARCQPRVVRSPAARAPGVRSGRSCHTQPTRPGSLPYGQPSAPGGLRIRAYGSPLARSAYGRVLSPPCAAVRPNARSTGARGQRASRPASGAQPTRGRPVCYRHALVRARPVHQPARAAKASLQRPPRQPPHATSGPTTGTATATRQRPQRPVRARDSPARSPSVQASTSKRQRAAECPTCDRMPLDATSPRHRLISSSRRLGRAPDSLSSPTWSPCRQRRHPHRPRRRDCVRSARPRRTTSA